jgi:nucleoside-diphosphate-sugar epimerase
LDDRSVVVAGCGFLGEATAGLFLKAGWRVLGLCASEDSVARLTEFPGAVLDITRPFQAPAGFFRPHALIHCASSRRGSAEDYRAVYFEGLKNVISAFQPQRLLFTGSTSVYAQTDGSLVTEDSPTLPDRETGHILLEAERLALDSGGLVARLSGIYGPGRSMLSRKLLEGTAVLEDGGTRWTNQIHRDDGAKAVFHLLTATTACGVFNVTDDRPATQRELYGWIAAHFNVPLPPNGPANMDRKRGWTSKRVCNAKLRATGWQPQYPDFRSALAAL